jgi:Leucine-rich repeat (LRR) protein
MKKFTFFLLFSILGIGNSMGQSCRLQDSLVLVDLYKATGGATWTLKTNWLTSNPIETWYGVKVNAQGCIDSLKLSTNRLNGKIPPSLGNLTTLRFLGLSQNRLIDTIPNDLGSLTNVEFFLLNDNQLTGRIPTTFKNLTNLQFLYLSSNQLTGNIPDSLEKLSRLVVIHLADNRLSGSIPAHLGNGNLWNLTELWLQNNQLSGRIPQSLGNLGSLEYLLLYNNQLTGSIPSNLAASINLLYVGLATNQLTGTIPNFTSPRLLELVCYGNQLSGEIPNFNLPNLTKLALSINQLSGAIPNFALPNLQELYLRNNQLTGKIPNFNFPNLTSFRLDTNLLTGCIPDSLRRNCPLISAVNGNIANNPNLATQNWANYWNNGTGACLAARLDTITALQCGTRTYRLPSGRIVNSIGTYADTSRGITQDTFFTVRLLADNTCRCTDSLALVDLYNATNGANWYRNTNWLTINPIHTWHGISVDAQGCVSHLILGSNAGGGDTTSNHLVGTLPASLGNLANLQYLCLPNSALRGAIPATFGQLSNLIKLSLYNNQLDSSLPSSLSGMSHLQQLWLANNQLSGNIPSNLGNLTNLTQLWLRNNQFNDTIPKELGRLTQLSYFNLAKNRLTGNIPDSLGNLVHLNLLFNLGDNQLTGVIPPSLGNLRKVQQISLYGNQLTGSLPTAFQRLDSLKYLYVFSNKIDSLPNLSGLSQLTIFQADTNRLTFKDILPNLSRGITYKQQDSLFRTRTYRQNAGSTVSIQLGIDSNIVPANVYKWYKNDTLYKTDSLNYLNINSLKLQDAGNYKCVVTNPNAPNLTLFTGNAQVQIICPPISVNRVRATICDGSVYAMPSGRTVDLTGVYMDTIKSWLGCDSVLTELTLRVNLIRTNVTVERPAICQGDSVRINGQWVKTSGVYYQNDTTANCLVTIHVILLDVIPRLSISIDTIRSPVSCLENGSMRVKLLGGIGGYNYNILWSNGSNAPTLTGLTAGKYWVTVTGDTVCRQVLTDSATLPIPLALSATMTKTDVSCYGQNNGAATVTASGGLSPYSYQWSNGQTSTSISSLISGTYTVTVTDALLCKVTKTDTITQPNEIQVPIDKTICEGDSFRNHTITGTFRDTVQTAGRCDTIIVVRLTVNPKVIYRDSVHCDMTRKQLTPITKITYLQNGCSTKVVTTIHTSYRDTQKVILCNPLAVGDTTPSRDTVSYWKCDSVLVLSKRLGIKLPPLEIPQTICYKEFVGTRVVYATESVSGFCQDTHYIQKLSIQEKSIPICHRSTYIEPMIERVGTCDITTLTRYTFDTCQCFNDARIHNGLITNDIDGLNDALFMVGFKDAFDKPLYPPLELLVLDKRGILLNQSVFNNDWKGTHQDGYQLPAGIYNYILRIQHDGCRQRRGVLDIKYID